jgi:hypothetical protein
MKPAQPAAEVGLQPIDSPALLVQRSAQISRGQRREILSLKRSQPTSIAERMFVFRHIPV